MRNKQCCFGFTLFEVIIIIALGALLFSMVMPYLYSGAMTSHEPINRLQSSAELNQAMETVVKDFETNYSGDASKLSTFLGKVNSFSENYGSTCSECTALAENKTVGDLAEEKVVFVTITNNIGESLYHLFTLQK